jgi:putative FmdB family regulatory protein
MPLYEYECQSCREHFEYQQKFSEGPKETCEQCGGALKRVMSLGGFALKGGGWYKDGYNAKPPSKKIEKSETKAPPPSEKKSTNSK